MPREDQPRAVTAEVVDAIRSTTAGKAMIAIRPEAPSVSRRFLNQPAADDISAIVPDSHTAEAVRKKLTQIARRHGLRTTETNSAGMLRVDFDASGIRTHTVRLDFPEVRKSTPEAATTTRSLARLAIIVDDMGNDQQAADALLALPVRLTISVLPSLPFSKEVADAAARRGDQVMLHLPMQPESETARPEAPELHPGMTEPEVRAEVTTMLETVPHASGVNNHEGSKATADPALMQALMPMLKERGLFFIDSRTTASTVAFDTAQRFGVRSASRKVFLDDTVTQESISRQIDLAISDAEHDGSAIAIGHPHAETIAVLRSELPRLREKGVQLVFASDLVH